MRFFSKDSALLTSQPKIFSLQSLFVQNQLDLTQFAYLSLTKMILNVLIAFSVLAAAVSAFDDNVGKVRKDGALHRHIVDCKQMI